ncbi:MAG TPA: hypothetical protein VMA95_05600 [Streptosporangiaceae bacterium]|nr:hypothetical protein [Streptosporangiaceae bacterium]
MFELVLLAVIVVVFIAGAVAGAILLVSLASIREDRRPLGRTPRGKIARAGRFVTGLSVKTIQSPPRRVRSRPPEPVAWSGGTTIRQRGIYN